MKVRGTDLSVVRQKVGELQSYIRGYTVLQMGK